MVKFKTPARAAEPAATEPVRPAHPATAPAAEFRPQAPIAREFDYLDLDALLTPDERAIRDRVRAFVDREVVPVAGEYWEKDETPLPLLHKLKGMGISGLSLKGYGCPGMSNAAAGLVAMELARGDGSLGTLFGVSAGLCMTSIHLCGSEEQKQRWLPGLASMELFGAFALTEPLVGSDASHIQTTARKMGDTYVLNGAKRWIGGGEIADVIVVWAQDDQTGQVGGFVVEKGAPGYRATKIRHKLALRGVPNADIVLEDCAVPAANRLVNARSFKDTGRVLASTRLGVAWAAIGHAQAAYELALQYAKGRAQFGRPIAGFQMIQDKLVRMLADLEYMKITTLHLSRLQDAGRMSDAQASLAKLHNAARAREIVALARETLGGNGILIDRHVARHFADMEAVYSYEGTNEVNTLVVGRDITGMQAFV